MELKETNWQPFPFSKVYQWPYNETMLLVYTKYTYYWNGTKLWWFVLYFVMFMCNLILFIENFDIDKLTWLSVCLFSSAMIGVLNPPTWKNDVVCITGLFRSLLIIWVLAKLKKFCCPKWLWHIPLGDPVVPEVQNITQVSVFVSWAWNGSGALFSLVISNLASMFWTPVTTPRLNRCTVWFVSASNIAMASLALLAVSSTHMTSLAFVSVNCKKQEWNPIKH